MNFSGENKYRTARTKHDKKFDIVNKNYYKIKEDYDWVKVVDHLVGLESIYHKLRERKVLQYLRSFLGKNIHTLDAGCGTGLILRHLPKKAIGIDLNPRHVKKAKINAPFATILEGDIENIHLKDRSIDLVICFETLEHLLFPEKAFKEFNRLLTKNGVFIGSVPRKSYIWRLRGLSSTHPGGEPFHREFREPEIKKLLSSSFKIIKIQKELFGMNFFFMCRKK